MDHKKYFTEALQLAKRAYKAHEVPIGAVVVDGAGQIVGRGYNQTAKTKDATAHAEVRALKQAQKKIGDWRLERAKLYVTVEPCLMCLGAALISRVKEIHFILEDPTFGSLRSVLKRTANKGAYKNVKFVHHKDNEWEVAALMKSFFEKLRKDNLPRAQAGLKK